MIGNFIRDFFTNCIEASRPIADREIFARHRAMTFLFLATTSNCLAG
jgi:hypothetical protein